jgi:hypothetical protein
LAVAEEMFIIGTAYSDTIRHIASGTLLLLASIAAFRWLALRLGREHAVVRWVEAKPILKLTLVSLR